MAHSEEIWAKVRQEYESGQISTRKLAQKYPMSRPTIRKRMKKEGWQKGRIVAEAVQEVEGLTKESIKSALLEHSIDGEKVAGKIEELLDYEVEVNVGGKKKENHKIVKVSNPLAIDKGLTQLAKYTGSYAAEKREFKGKVTVKKEYDEKSLEELQNALDRRLKERGSILSLTA